MTNNKQRIEEQVTAWAFPIAEELGIKLVDVEWVKEGGYWYLRIFIDKEAGVDLDDCQELSHRLNQLLDGDDPITQKYFLEVSSPGLERRLKTMNDFEQFKGETIRLTTFSSHLGTKEHIGKLLGRSEVGVMLATAAGEITIPWEQVAAVRLYVQW
ncbi:MAG: ribosome maturation factor RimP [Heliobacteriaceae bacterium]|nr:ribosome maturation factor RimP [Heliobacteriaceae bacterium]MDD4588416.1 ribosome maturation factor RimP [Heliobacteriaceae bacterium]